MSAYNNSILRIFTVKDGNKDFNYFEPCGLRKFTFGFNGLEFTHDALIKYQAMTYGSTLLHILLFRNFFWIFGTVSKLVPID